MHAGELQDQPAKSENPRTGQSSGQQQSARINHLSTQQPKLCPQSKIQQTFQVDENTCYRTSLFFCDAFKTLSVDARAALVQSNKGCSLCLNWTGTHQKDNCQTRVGRDQKLMGKCNTVDNNGGVCNKKHHRFIHGTANLYCNMVRSIGTERTQVLSDSILRYIAKTEE